MNDNFNFNFNFAKHNVSSCNGDVDLCINQHPHFLGYENFTRPCDPEHFSKIPSYLRYLRRRSYNPKFQNSPGKQSNAVNCALHTCSLHGRKWKFNLNETHAEERQRGLHFWPRIFSTENFVNGFSAEWNRMSYGDTLFLKAAAPTTPGM